MKRFVSLFFFALVLMAPSFASAQTPTISQNPTAGALHIVCLTASGEEGNHTTYLSGTPFYPDKHIEIWRKVFGEFQCAIDAQGKSTCSGGTRTVGEDFQVRNAVSSQIIGTFQGQLTVDSDGKAETREAVQRVFVKTKTIPSTTHVFYGVQQLNLSVLDSEQTALKLSTFFPPVGGTSTCVSVKWDPYGIVFDAVSLEPIKGVPVTLYKNSISPANIVPEAPGVPQNPFIVPADGMFSFIVDDGNYYLTPQVPTNFTYPLSPSQISSLTTSQDSYSDLYTGDVIRQQGSIQHRDIPLMPKDPNNPTNTKPEITVYLDQYCVEQECYQMAYGSCSHPKCIVTAYQGGTAIADAKVTVDKNRAFTMYIKNNLINQALPLEFKGEKTPVSLSPTPSPTQSAALQFKIGAILSYVTQQINALFTHPVEAQNANVSSAVNLYSVPAYIHGYAYDKSLKTLPNTRVYITVPAMDDRIAFTTKSDKNGLITIPQNDLPPVAFDIKLVDKNNKTLNKMSTNTFVVLNKTYLEKNKINLLILPTPSQDNAKASYVVPPLNQSGGLNFEEYIKQLTALKGKFFIPPTGTAQEETEQTSGTENQQNLAFFNTNSGQLPTRAPALQNEEQQEQSATNAGNSNLLMIVFIVLGLSIAAAFVFIRMRKQKT